MIWTAQLVERPESSSGRSSTEWCSRLFGFIGGIAQLVERLNGIQEVGGSNPPTSTNNQNYGHMDSSHSWTYSEERPECLAFGTVGGSNAPTCINNPNQLFFVYILQSITTGAFYTGHCDNLIERFHEHQSGFSKATRGRGPWWMPYYEIFHTLSEAQTRENEISSKKSSRYIRTVIYAQDPLIDLY
jgi:putative endonuclease